MKKVNLLNVIFSFISLIIYMYLAIKNSGKYTVTYGVDMLYLGAGLSITLILFSLFKKLRNGFWMDIIFMVYVLLFIIGNFIAIHLGNNIKLYGVFVNYPIWFKYSLIVLLAINIIMFIFSLKDDSDE